jgi:hypothetical protein
MGSFVPGSNRNCFATTWTVYSFSPTRRTPGDSKASVAL